MGVVALVLAGFGLALADTAEQLVDGMIEAHGGWDAWAEAPSVTFEDDWSHGRGFRTTVEQGSRRAYLDSPRDGGPSIVWDGERCWSVGWPADGPPPRFLVHLNWYFLNLPWVLRDPGVNLAEPTTGRLLDDPTDYEVIRVTFDEGIGDTPRDWYDVFIHPTSYRLKACRYVVTYRALLPEGIGETAPRTLVYDEWDRAGGLMVPSRLTIYEEDGAAYASCEISGWSFSELFDESRMTMPAGAVVDSSTP